jgi:glutathione S-transferase
MKLVLISHPICPYVHRAAAMLHHKQVAFELRYVDLDVKPRPDWFVAMSPRGKVPVLLADDRPLFESTSIMEFLDETHPPRVLPEEPFERARQRAWIEVANDLFAADFKVVTAPAGEVDAARAVLDGVLARFEAEVRGPWFAGERLGIVDLAVAPAAVRLELMARRGLPLLGGFPKVAAWSAALAALPAVVRATHPDFEARYLAFVRQRAGQLGAVLTASPARSGSAA